MWFFILLTIAHLGCCFILCNLRCNSRAQCLLSASILLNSMVAQHLLRKLHIIPLCPIRIFFNYIFHCICWSELAWKWISMAVGNRALADGKEENEKEMPRWRSSIFILIPTYKMWPAQRDSLRGERCGKISQVYTCTRGSRMIRKDGWMRWERGTGWKRQGYKRGEGI